MSCPGARVPVSDRTRGSQSRNSSRTLSANWFCRLSLQRVNFPLKCNRNRIECSQLDGMEWYGMGSDGMGWGGMVGMWCSWPRVSTVHCPLSIAQLMVIGLWPPGYCGSSAPEFPPFQLDFWFCFPPLFSLFSLFFFVNDMRAKVTALMGSKDCPTVGIHLKAHWKKQPTISRHQFLASISWLERKSKESAFKKKKCSLKNIISIYLYLCFPKLNSNVPFGYAYFTCF